MFTSVRSLYNSGETKTSKFYLHNGQYINDIYYDSKKAEYTILYANGHLEIVDGSSKVKVIETK